MQVQEAAAGNKAVDMPDVWINLAHVYLAQGQFALAIKMVSTMSLLGVVFPYRGRMLALTQSLFIFSLLSVKRLTRFTWC